MSSSILRSSSRVGLVLGLLFLTGCGDDQPNTIRVSTKVLVNQQPAEGAQVTLHPVEADWKSKFPHRPFGIVKSDGTIEFSTFQPNDGVPEGEYVVTLNWASEKNRDNDRLGGAHQNPTRTNPIKVKVDSKDPELQPIEVTSNIKARR
jgi:hypothetical protein